MRQLLSLVVCFMGVLCPIEGGTVGSFSRRLSLQNALMSYTCRSSNGLMCNSRGRCVSGKCLCEEDMVSKTCEPLLVVRPSTTMAPDRGPWFDTRAPTHVERGPEIIACFGNNEGVCNGHGVCVGGTCLCEPQWAGVTCELQNRIGFCETYRSCAECTALLRKCPANCSIATRFRLVNGFPISGGTFHRCRYRNSEEGCSYYFQLDSVSANLVKNINVKTCAKYRAATTTMSETTDQSAVSTEMPTTTTQEVTSVQLTSSTSPITSPPSEDTDDRDFCEKHRECAECTALFTQCPEDCARKAKYFLVFGFPILGGSFHRCRFRNTEHNCNFYFQLDNSNSDGITNIMVKTCLKYKSTTPLPGPPKLILAGSVTKIAEVTSTQKQPEVTPSDVIDDDETTTESINEENDTDRNTGTDTGSDNGDNGAGNAAASWMTCIFLGINTITLYFVRYD